MKRSILLTLCCLALATIPLNAVAKVGLKLKVFPADYIVQVDDAVVKPVPVEMATKRVFVDKGKHTIIISCEGYVSKVIKLDLQKDLLIEEKLEKAVSGLSLVEEVTTGGAPKSVEYTPDGKYMVLALLQGGGVDVFSTKTMKKVKTITVPEKFAKKKGFVETVFCKKRNEMWVTQMQTDHVHVMDLKTLTYKTSIPTGGVFCKVMLFSDDESTLYVSNWLSQDVSVIDAVNYKLIRKLKVTNTPRGLALSPDNKFLYVCIFDGNRIEKIDLKTGKIVKAIVGSSSMRHIVSDRKNKLFFASAMGSGQVVVISMENDQVIKRIPVGHKPNTIKLSQDRRFLFVSTRGPNNPKTYYIKGPEFGKIVVIDTKTLEVKEWIWGKNQPTGLDVSPDGKYLVFTDFLDDNLEVYRINY